MARVLSQAELATYRQTLLAYQVAITLLSLGLANGIYYFLPTEKTRARGIVVDALVMMVVMGLIYAVFIALGGNHLLAQRFSNSAIVTTLTYLVPLPVVMLPAGLLASVMVVQNQVNKLTVYNVLTNVVLAVGIIAACLHWRTPEAMVLIKVGIGFAIGIIGIHLMLKAVPRGDWRPRFHNMKAMVVYSIPLATATALGTIFLQLDKIIVSSMCSPEQFAIYSNGAIEIPLVGIITGSIGAVIQPDLRRLVAVDDKLAALALFRQAAEKSAVILIPVMIFLLVSAEPFILTLFSKKYADSILPFRLYLLMLPIRIAQYGALQMALGLNKAILYRTVVSLPINLVLSILFVRWCGFIGAIIGTIITLYAFNCVWNFSIISRAMKCRWSQILPFKSLFQVSWAAVLSVTPVVLIGYTNIAMPSAMLLALNAGVYGIMLTIVAWTFHIESLEREMRRVFAKLRK